MMQEASSKRHGGRAKNGNTWKRFKLIHTSDLVVESESDDPKGLKIQPIRWIDFDDTRQLDESPCMIGCSFWKDR